MRILSLLIIGVVVLLSACSRTREFRAQAEAGQQIVKAIEEFRKKTGNYPASLADLGLKHLPTVSHGPGQWEYRAVTNVTGMTFTLSYFMGKGGVQYVPPVWFANDDGHEMILFRND